MFAQITMKKWRTNLQTTKEGIMPNWCMNILSVSGEDSLVKKFRNAARGHTQAYNRFSSVSWPIHDDIRLKAAVSSLPDMGEVSDLSFHALYPVPEDFMRYPYDCNSAREFGERVGETRPYGGYGWETTHWGVKWGACRPEVVSEAEEIIDGRLQSVKA